MTNETTPDTSNDTLGEDLGENFDRFIVEAIDHGCVWALQGPEGWALCESEKHANADVIPFWSQESFAKVHCADDWEGYTPLAVDLEEFLEDWLPGMHEDVILVGVNWNEDLEGDEMEPLDLLEEFEQELAP